jgi:hypothetical protein
MQEKTQNSFIPKAKSSASVKRSSYNPYTVTGVSIFFVVILVSAGFFFYGMYLDYQIQETKKNLVNVDEIFKPEFVQDLVIADARIRASEKSLDERVAPTMIFKVLEDLTAQGIYFNSFNYLSHKINQAEEDSIVVLTGVASSFNNLAFQTDVFKEEERVKEVMVRNIKLADDVIFFNVTLNFSEEVILYKENI